MISTGLLQMHVTRTTPHLRRCKKLIVGSAHILARLRQHLLNCQFARYCILWLLDWILGARVGVPGVIHNKRLALKLLLWMVRLGLVLLLILLLQMKPVLVELLNGRFTGSWKALVTHNRATCSLTAMIEEISSIVFIVHTETLRVRICSDHPFLITLLLNTVSELVHGSVCLQLFQWRLVCGER